ncbi:LAFA_0F06238g1_1 [Lachancea sp. 'fantastica']|nr:LAFA_0F06238g1_1 [Lachancea sp. 'fantastica']
MAEGLLGFLKCLKSSYLAGELFNSSRLLIVCGNESADLDSVVSAITYAYFSYIKNPGVQIVPVINILKADLELRRDIVWVLKKRNIPHNLLYFHEDLHDMRKRFRGPIEAVLVDHNDSQSLAKKVVDSVVGIIDHHEDLGLHKDISERHGGPRIIRPAGSCSSLVFNFWNESLKNGSEQKFGGSDALSLCLGALLIDTTNMAYKVEDPDKEAHAAYKELLPNVDFEVYSSQLRQAKDDIAGLSLRDILRKDYKEFVFSKTKGTVKCGFASVVKPFNWINAQFPDQQFLEACSKFVDERNLDLLLILTSWTDSKAQFKRQIALYVKEKRSMEVSSKVIENITALLKLQSIEVLEAPCENCAFFAQLNTNASRKQVVPYVQEACRAI